jgi:hypothetical protein
MQQMRRQLEHMPKNAAMPFSPERRDSTECRSLAVGTVFVLKIAGPDRLFHRRSIRAGIAGSLIRTSFPDQFLPLGRQMGQTDRGAPGGAPRFLFQMQ